MEYKIAVVVSIFIILAVLNKLTDRNNKNPYNRR
jgi:hypothetical protein